MKVKKNVKIAIISLVVLIAVLSIAVFVILKIKKSNTTRGFMDPYNDNTSAEDLVPIQIDKKGDLKNRAKVLSKNSYGKYLYKIVEEEK